MRHCQAKRNCDKRRDNKSEKKGEGEWEYMLKKKKKKGTGLCV